MFKLNIFRFPLKKSRNIAMTNCYHENKIFWPFGIPVKNASPKLGANLDIYLLTFKNVGSDGTISESFMYLYLRL